MERTRDEKLAKKLDSQKVEWKRRRGRMDKTVIDGRNWRLLIENVM